LPLSLDCKNGEVISFPCCGGSGTGSFVFTGIEVTDDSGNATFLHAPYEVQVTSTGVFISDYKRNNFFIPLSEVAFDNIDDLIEYVTECRNCNCQADPADGEDSNGGAICFYRQTFQDVNTNVIEVTANQGEMPQGDKTRVYFNGRLLRNGVDYQIQGAFITFNFDVVRSNIEVIFLTPCSLAAQEFCQFFVGVNTSTVTVTVNGGMPQDKSEVEVYFNGRLMTEGQDFNFSGNDIVFLFDVVDSTISVIWLDRQQSMFDAKYIQTELSHSSQTLTITANGGSMPDNSNQVLVMHNGRLMIENLDYSLSGNVITFNFTINEARIQVILFV